MMRKTFTALGLALLCAGTMQAQTARFTAEESMQTYYEQGWDSMEEATQWSYSPTAQGNFTWHLEATPPYSGQQAFSSIDPRSQYSLCVRYSSTDAQNEVAASPTIHILPNSVLEFYACFRSVFLFDAPWYFYIVDVEADTILHTMNAFLWSQFNEFTGPAWQKFSIDLSDYAGRNVSFAFQFTGPGGEDLAIDGFRLMRSQESSDAIISVAEGGSVHFLDRSEGDPVGWEWHFDGGQPEVSYEQHPVVVYPQAGVYDVTLTVMGADDVSTVTRQGYVHVVAQAPQALIGLPAEGYLSPWVARFVPVQWPVHYADLSSGVPTQWHWTFEGAEPSESTEPAPVVVYPEPGLYGMTLKVANSVGTSTDFMVRAVQAGGSQYVWNIDLDEYDQMGEVALGWYGYYAGTNWLGMERFAERFEAPTCEAVIDSVQVYFYRTKTVSPQARITVDVRRVAPTGEPGEVLAEGEITASQLAYDPQEIVATSFRLNQSVTLSEPFFITIGPFPNNTEDGTWETDDISIMCVHRGEGGKTTTWHLLEDEDPATTERLGTYTWFENTDDPVSLCLTPRLTYNNEITAVQPLPATTTGTVAVYGLDGRRRSSVGPGISIVRQADGTVKKVMNRH